MGGSDVHASKRARREVFAASEYAAGAIRRVTLHNFMSYSDAELFDPGPRLNCIVGPNGTGKSSIVNALAIGLGGSLKITERGSSADDAIKKDCDSGFVEIELRDGNGAGKNLVVRCDLTRSGGRKTDYSLDGKRVSLKEVKERMASLGIQIDNMLQFLPQDRVAQFTQMKPTELLVNTMKATLPDEYAEHAELIRLSTHAAELAVDRDARQKELEKALSLQEGYQGEVDRLHAFQANEAKKRQIIGKQLWRGAFARMSELEDKKNAARAAKEARRKAERALAEVDGPLADAQAALQQAKAAANAAGARLHEAKARAAKLDQEANGPLLDKCDELDEKLTNIERDANERKEAAAKADAQLSRARAELDAMPACDEEGTRAEITRLDAEMRRLSGAKEDADEAVAQEERALRERKLQLQRSKHELALLDDESSRRQQKVRQNAEGAKALQLAQWIKENQNSFKGEVIGPIGLECEAADAQSAVYLESAIPRHVLTGFLCELREDRDKLAKHVQDQRIHLNIYHCDQSRVKDRPPYAANTAEMCAFGITGWLCDSLSARKDVKSFVTELASLNTTLCAKETIAEPATMKAFEAHMRAEGRTSYKLYTPRTIFSATTSRYGERKQIIGAQPLRLRNGALFFDKAGGADPHERARRAELVERDSREVDAAQAAVHEARELLAEATAAVAEVRQARSKVGSQAQLVVRARAKVAELAAKATTAHAAADPSKVAGQKASLQADVDRLLDRLAAKAAELAKAHAATAAESVAAQCGALVVKRAAEAEREAREACEAARTEAAAAARTEEAAKGAARRANEALLRAVNEAQDAAPEFAGAAPSAFTLTGAAKEAWEGLPDDDDALADELQHVQDILSRSEKDVDALRRYNENADKIAALRERLDQYAAQAADQGASLASRRAAWEPKVREMASHVSAKFAEYFAAFNCVGEVELADAPKMEDYALNIKVKWRSSEELHVLSSGGRDSGGERSVATMVYLIALQDVNPCPFRVVDEINQAMDPTNERRIFECITKAVASQRSRTQYFLITPKLLPDLHYSAHTSVHFIYNGPYMLPASQMAVDLSAEAGGARRASASPDDDE